MKDQAAPITFSKIAKTSTFGLITRRDLLKQAVAISAGLVVGSGFIANSKAAWALELKALDAETMATLIQVARDIFPHDKFDDAIYATAVKGHDTKAAENPEHRALIEFGIAELDALAKETGHENYLNTGWEADRVALLKQVEAHDFFQALRGALVVDLYNQEAVWKKLGYEGSSFEHGGYLNRGFDDITWL